MTDETRPEGQPSEAATAVAPPPGEPAAKKLRQEVEMQDVGPCKKHIKVVVNREDIDAHMGEHYSKLVVESNVTGFRPGKAPRRLIEKRYHKEVSDQVKNEVLMASLEQLGTDNDVAPLSPPEIDPAQIEIPLKGPMVYEFTVEVRPHFDLPPYKGMKIRRPMKTFTETDIALTRRMLLGPSGQVVPKEDGVADLGDVVVADVTFRSADQVVNTASETSFQVENQLAFKDGLVRRFGEKIKGAKAGDWRTVDVELSSSAAGDMAGKTLQATFAIKDVKTIRLPELTPEFLQEHFGITSPGLLDEMILAMLQRNLEHRQRRSARLQVIGQISAASQWDLPPELLMRQAHKALARRVMEMKGDGVSDQEIQQQQRLLEQDILQTTALLLKEHFVMQKIAETEKIDIDEDDLNDEIERIAVQYNDSPRRIRARLEKEDALDTLAAEMIERKAMDLVLNTAEYVDEPMAEEEWSPSLGTVDFQVVPGVMRDPAAEAEAAAAEKKDEG